MTKYLHSTVKGGSVVPYTLNPEATMSSSYPQHDSCRDEKIWNQRIPNRIVLGSTLKTDVIDSYSSCCNQYHFCTIHAGLWIGWNTESYSICCFCSLFMFNLERPLPVGLFQTVQAFAVNCHNLLQCSLQFSLQTTYPQSHRGSCVRMSPLMHQPSSQGTTKSVEFRIPFNLKSFFGCADWNKNIQSIKYYKCHVRYPQMISIFGCHLPSAKCANLKDLGSVVKESFHDVLSVQWNINPPGSPICCFQRTFFFCVAWCYYRIVHRVFHTNTHPKIPILLTYRCFQIFFQCPRCQVPSSSYSSILEIRCFLQFLHIISPNISSLTGWWFQPCWKILL